MKKDTSLETSVNQKKVSAAKNIDKEDKENKEKKASSDQSASKADAKEAAQKKMRDDFSLRLVNFHGLRCMKMWVIVMISLGRLPFSDLRDSLKENDKKFNNDYKRRIRFLKGRLTTHPETGLALSLPYYPGTDADTLLDNRYLDVVSAFEVLREKYKEDIPEEVHELEKSVKHIPLPSSAHDEIPENKKAKRDQAKTIAALMNQNMQTLFVQLVVDKYGTLTAKTMGGIADVMAKDLKVTGLKLDAIKTQLRLALSGDYE
ncbi:hypothetical protein [Variovorax sp. DXTD-1]|uniref:hypothetical protein n=1 Tax=Variovorax sp. DXTD-1 TaxID=2495592 RepID=UPI000F87E2B7|nr:hypothetical protein [Variovorax sp. DXTD-1]RST54055.1 hypothetical protein EJI00_02715 [Variovorax sp. DXTD-1]